MNNKIHEILLKLEKQSQLEKQNKINIPENKKMLSITYATGKFLNLLLKYIKAKHILEIGTSVGYSALWFVDAVIHNDKQNCKVITIESDAYKIQQAKNNFMIAGVLDKIEIKHGDALQILNAINQSKKNTHKFDFVFIDADKNNIKKYFSVALSLIKTNGIIITDNILLPKKYNHIMTSYLEYIRNIPNVITITLHVGNGEEMSIKIR